MILSTQLVLLGVTIQVLSKRRRGECRVPNHMFENRFILEPLGDNFRGNVSSVRHYLWRDKDLETLVIGQRKFSRTK